MSGIEKVGAAKISAVLSKIVKDVVHGHDTGHRTVADHIKHAADRIEAEEKRLAADAAGLGTKTHGSIKPGESVPYREGTIRGRGVKGDGLTPDHIPSRAALVKAKEKSLLAAETKRLGRQLSDIEKEALLLTNAEKAAIRDKGWTLVKEADFHQSVSRSWGPRNTAKQIAEDAKDLAVAVEKEFVTDLSAIEKSGGLTQRRVGEYAQHYRNLVNNGVIGYSDRIDQVLRDFLKKAK